MSTPLPPRAEIVRAANLAGYRWFTRIISEIADNGRIPHGALHATFPDIPEVSLPGAVKGMRIRGLLQADEQDEIEATALTEAGRDLGDVYDALARWARRYDHPVPQAGFITRVEAVLNLLRDPSTVDLLTGATSAEDGQGNTLARQAGLLTLGAGGRTVLTEAGEDLRRPLAALADWAAAHPEVVQTSRKHRRAMPATYVRPVALPQARTTPSRHP